MQTFIIGMISETAKALDSKRLWKQCIESKQILKAISDSSYGWQNHPIVQMWRGHEGYLKFYLQIMLEEWLNRRFGEQLGELCLDTDVEALPVKPEWISDPEVINSHRANLYFKDPEHYKQFKGEYDKANKDSKGKPEYVWVIEKLKELGGNE